MCLWECVISKEIANTENTVCNRGNNEFLFCFEDILKKVVGIVRYVRNCGNSGICEKLWASHWKPVGRPFIFL